MLSLMQIITIPLFYQWLNLFTFRENHLQY
jgi:hypothetical protein